MTIINDRTQEALGAIGAKPTNAADPDKISLPAGVGSWTAKPQKAKLTLDEIEAIKEALLVVGKVELHSALRKLAPFIEVEVDFG